MTSRGQNAPVPTLLLADGRNGFAQVALAASRDGLTDMARTQGMAALCAANAHHFAAQDGIEIPDSVHADLLAMVQARQ